MTLRELIQGITAAFRELVELAIDLVRFLWTWLLDLPAIYYILVLLAVVAFRPALYLGEQCTNTFRAIRGLAKLESIEDDWGYRFGLYLRRLFKRFSSSPPEGP